METLRNFSIAICSLLVFASCSKDDAATGPTQAVRVETENLGVKMVATQAVNSDLVDLVVTTDSASYPRSVRFFSKEHSMRAIDRVILVAKDQTHAEHKFRIKEGGLVLEKIVIYEVKEVK